MTGGRYIFAVAALAACGRRIQDAPDPVADEQPPTAVAGDDRSGTPGQRLVFDASASRDADGTIVGFAWTFGDGTPAQEGAVVEHAFAANGIYGVTLTVTDDDGRKAVDTVRVVIDESNPTVSFTVSAERAYVGEELVFDGSASTAVSAIVAYRWSFGDSTTGTGAGTYHAYDIPGVFRVRLTVEDDAGRRGEHDRQVTIDELPAGPRPVAAFTASRTRAEVLVPITFDASASSGPSPLVAYRWDFGDSTADAGAVVTHAFDIPGSFRVRLLIEDDQARTAGAAETITIDAATRSPPTASFTATPAESTVGTSVTFDASGSTSAGSIVGYRWSFGDSSCTFDTCPTGVVVSHTYEFAGSFRVTLRVEDDVGLVGEASSFHTANEPAQTTLDVSGAFNVTPDPANTSRDCGSYTVQLTDTIITLNPGGTASCSGRPMTGFGVNGTSYSGCMSGSSMSISARQQNYAAGGGCTTTRTTTLNVTFSDVDTFTGTEVVYHDGRIGCTCSWIVNVTGRRR